eukprot:182554-Pelagomonas_calceolata.AAC.1
MVPKLAAIKVEEGKQFHLGTWYKPEDLLARLILHASLHSSKSTSRGLTSSLLRSCQGGLCSEMQGVQEHHRPANPSQAIKQHNVSCKQPMKPDLVELTGEGSSHGSRQIRHRDARQGVPEHPASPRCDAEISGEYPV